jgi:hypothetical protein
VGDHEEGDVQAAEDVGELAARRGVQVARRLVEDQDLRAHGQHGGDGHAAPLPEGQVVRGPVGEVGHAHGLEGLDDAGVELRAPDTEVRRTERDVVAHRRHEELVVGVLEDQAHPSPDLEQVGLGDRQPGDGDRPVARPEDAVEVEDERGLPGTVRAEQGDPLPRVHVQVDAEQGLVAARVRVRDLPEVEDGHAHAARTATVTTAATSAGASATVHWAGVADSSCVTGSRPLQPRLTIARCTRSPRS